MADRRGALEALDGGAIREAVADEAELALGVEDAAVEGDDAGGFLAAVLQGVEPKRDDRRGIRVAVDAEDAAFLAQGVAVEVGFQRGFHLPPVGRCCHERRSFGAPGGPTPSRLCRVWALWRQPRRRS